MIQIIKSNIIIGTFKEAPKFLQDNEYIKNGYIINCTTFKQALVAYNLFL